MAKEARRAACTLGLFVMLYARTSGVTDHQMPDSRNVTTPPSRLRTGEERLSALISKGALGSATFRALIASIEGSDGLVYFSTGKCGEHVAACLLMRLDQAGPNRMLRIVISSGRADLNTIASIAHELQHAVEVLNNHDVRTTEDLFVLYQRIAMDPPSAPLQSRIGFRFETAKAIEIGDAVRDELQRTARPSH